MLHVGGLVCVSVTNVFGMFGIPFHMCVCVFGVSPIPIVPCIERDTHTNRLALRANIVLDNMLPRLNGPKFVEEKCAPFGARTKYQIARLVTAI